ncbi:MAG: ion transporter [Phycisphaera sp.]|nr:ion transporter [Phycisphaera sp.]
MAGWRRTLHTVIFEAETPAGKAFDVVLLILITLSVLCVMVESIGSAPGVEVPPWRRDIAAPLRIAEWTFTLLFTVEYVLRLLCVRRPRAYALSAFGVIDLLAVLPTYLSLFVPGGHSLMVIRALRLLRVFRVFKLGRYLSEAGALRRAVWAARAKLTVFLATVLILACIMGTLMYLVEFNDNPQFRNIPQSIYWAIVTVTTVGYGDISPVTPLGKLLAAMMMVLGWGMIIVSTGVLSAELVQQSAHKPVTTQACPSCGSEGHDTDALHCKFCGAHL